MPATEGQCTHEPAWPSYLQWRQVVFEQATSSDWLLVGNLQFADGALY